tara:strand:- start:243 stop:881 length:639 start_codon:yes stop_codon:yes gene_type:complete
MIRNVTLAAGLVVGLTTAANADYSFSQSADQAPTYSTTLNFDEPGGPTGVVDQTAWQAGYGLQMFDGLGPSTFVGDLNSTLGYPWLPTDNSAFGMFGIYLKFDTAVDHLSFQAWDNSGDPSPMGGGFSVLLLNPDFSSYAQSDTYTPAWGGIGDTWYDVQAGGGDSFDFVFVTGWGFSPETVIDNMSWTTVPAPGSIALFGVALLGNRRRRS